MADSEKKVGITIALKDAVTAGAKKIKDKFEQTKKEAKALGESASKSMAAIGKAVVVLNQGLELAKKAWGAINRTVGESIRMALEQRAATDTQLKAWTALSDRLQIIGGYIGDFFIPVILGIADAFEPTIKATETWAKGLKETQGSGFVEWLMDFGKTMIGVVAKSVVAATRTWAFMRIVIEGLKAAIQSYWAMVINGAGKAIGVLGSLAEKLGAGGVAASLKSASEEAKLFGSTFQESADANVDEINRLLEEQMKLEQGIKETEAAVQQAFGKAGPAIMRRFGEDVKKVHPRWKEMAEAAKAATEKIRAEIGKTADAIAVMVQKRTAMWEREAAAAERNGQLQQAIAERNLELAQKELDASKALTSEMISGYGTVRGAATDFFSNIGQGTEGAKAALQGLSGMFLRIAEEQIVANIASQLSGEATAQAEVQQSAAVAGAKEAEANAGLFPFGIGFGIAAAAAAAIIALITGFAKFQTGGVVGGNGRSGDRHIIMAEQGEAVLDRETTGALAAALSGRGRSPVSRGGGSSRGKSGGGGETHYHFESKPQYLAMPNSADYQRSYKDTVLPVQKRLQKIGAI